MKSFRPYAIAILLFFVWLTCQSCTADEATTPTETVRSVNISNDGKPFEYWLNKEVFRSQGEVVFIYVPIKTQITIGATVEVVDGIEVIPNIQLYQDLKPMPLKQITKGFYCYEVR